MTTAEELQKILESPEGARVEFKAASGSFSFEGRIRVEGQRRRARWLPAPAERRNESEIAKRSKPDA